MIKDIREINFPDYATLEQATVTINDMGDRTITSQVKIDGDVVPDFSYDWEIEFKGERYIHPVRTPQGTKDNTSRKAKIDLVFHHWAIYEMKRQYFVEMTSTTAGTAIADKYIASLGLNLGDFITAFNLVLNHYFGGRIVIRLNPEWQYDTEAKFVSVSYSYIWDVLQQMHEIYGVRWTLKTNADGVCEILLGYPAEEVSHIFEYGFEGGLLSVQRQVQNTEIRNRLLGRGGEKNLPYRYFKDKDPNNPLFEADPDWIPELSNIAFTELRGKTFRDYVRGWKARHYDGNAMEEPTEAYLAGYNAEKFDPIEYVEDKDSVAKYGVLVGALENNEDIYPSIQGAPGDVDMIVDAEQVTDDDVNASVEEDSVEENIKGKSNVKTDVKPNTEVSISLAGLRSGYVYFTVPEGKVGTILTPSFSAKGSYRRTAGGSYVNVPDGQVVVYPDKCTFTVREKSTGNEVSRLNIPPGEYYYEAIVVASHVANREINISGSVSSIHLITKTDKEQSSWSNTFDIWVRNIWGSSRNSGETDQQYADRVWAPILGDRTGGEARVVFASGWLSFSSDWEFPIVGYAYDDSKNGSHWRLTLAKSEAELEASGKYIPYEGYNASAGDRFFFIGIDMPYQYVLWAEERLDNFKRDSLLKTAEINPTWVIKTDKVRLNQDREGAVLVDSLNAGAQIRLASKQFISGAYETLYVQSVTYTWNLGTILYPDVEIVVSDKVYAVKNPVAQIQSNIESIQRQVGSISNIQQIIRQVCDTLYLRKDGVSDVSKSPTRFLGKVTGEKFRQGQIGGQDWGIYRDENGNAIFEADRIVARQGILVNELIVNEATYVGGLQINSAASMNVTAVEETDAGYICYFDQKQGSVTNKFKVDDVAFCQQFDAGDTEVKFYKSRVIAVDEGSITISKTEINGTGIPAEDDVIIQYGNYTDKTRQFVITRDVIGGGYERMLMGLDSVESDGVEYYFAGKSADSTARWFVGSKEQFAEYKDGQLTIKGNIFVTGSDKNISEQIAQFDFIREAFGENAQGLILGTAIIVGYTDENGNFVPMAGLSGVYDKDAENGGPAAWYGGTPENAKSVIFMDGTGYFADGLFKWDRDKGVNLGNGAIKINYDGSVEFGGDIKIGGTGEKTLDSLLTIVARLTDMWYLENGVVKSKYPIMARGYAAGATASVAEGGGGAILNKESIIAALGYTPYDSANPKGYITVSALTGYATESWVLGRGYITQAALNGYATEAWVLGKKYASAADLSTLRTDFDALNKLLNDDTSGVIDTWNEVVAFLKGYGDSTELASILASMNSDISSRALAVRKISGDETTIVGGGDLTADRALSLKSGIVATGTYTKVTVDTYGRVTAGTTLSASDIPELPISKITSLQSTLDTFVTLAGAQTISGSKTFTSPSYYKDSIFLGSGSANGIYLSSDGIRLHDASNNFSSEALLFGSDVITSSKHINPSGSALYLGTSSSRWQYVYSQYGNFSEELQVKTLKIGTVTLTEANGILTVNGLLLATNGLTSATALSESSGTGSLIFTGPWSDYTSEKSDYALAASLGYDLHTRVTSLEGKATNVKFTQVIAAGKQIGTISIDGASTNLYAPSTYAWSEITDRPTKLSQFTDDVVSGKYLPLSGGTMSNTNVVTNLNADLLDGYHSSNLAKFYLSPMSIGAPADSAKDWFIGTMPAGTGAIVYNVPGSEKTIIVGKSTGAYGHMLQLNYEDNYLRILRYFEGNWQSDDWEKVSAGYADASGKWATARTITLTGSVTGSVSINGSANVTLATTTNHTHTFASLTSKPTTIGGYGITDALTTSNYNSYSPKLDGTGATGTWGISISGNAVSATKLATARTIWGQSFDGTGNVSGALTGVTSITASGHAKVNSLKTQYICIECDNNGNTDGRNSEINNFVEPLYIQYKTYNHCVICAGGGSVGIGTAYPRYKLDVIGTLGVSGATTLASTLYVSGATTIASTLNVSGRATIEGGITSKGNHDFISQSNEFNFIPDSYSGVVGINTRTASSNLNGNVTEYLFFNGAGAYSDIRCKNLYATGNTLQIGSATLTWNGSALVVDKPLVSTSFAAGATATASSSGGGNYGPVRINVTALCKRATSVPQSTLASYGLTATVIENMADGLYTKVIDTQNRASWTYEAYIGANSIYVYLRQGDGQWAQSSIAIESYNSGSAWDVYFDEI